MAHPAALVQPVHFEDFDGVQFERLVFAYHARIDRWKSLEWYGQVGSDLGRDIWGIREDGESVCIQCVNRTALTFAKIRNDLSKVLSAARGRPSCFRIVGRANVSASKRDQIRAHVLSTGVVHCDIWSGKEFEEFLRYGAESLLKRFVEGEAFPDNEPELTTFAQAGGTVTDSTILGLLARLFDRPAFYTPIHDESDLGDFKQAITDTIEGLGTGIWKARDGNIIDRIPSRHQLKDNVLRAKMQAVEMALSRLRAKYDEMIRLGVLRPCGCNNPNCRIFFFHPPQAAHELEHLRDSVLTTFREAYPSFQPRSW